MDWPHIARLKLFVLIVAAAAVASCSGVPDGVIPPEEMARLLADLNEAESVVDHNLPLYPDDSSRLVLKQSVYARNGVTSAMVDSSFMYYGRHLKQYMEIHDRAIEILQERLGAAQGAADRQSAALAVAGDSVNVWNGASHTVIDSRSPARLLTFDLPADAHWKRGDVYTWSFKVLNASPTFKTVIAVEYDDGTTDYHADTRSLEGGRSLALDLYTDSTRTPRRLFGTMLPDAGDARLYLDSISLVRRRLDKKMYFRRYDQKTIQP